MYIWCRPLKRDLTWSPPPKKRIVLFDEDVRTYLEFTSEEEGLAAR